MGGGGGEYGRERSRQGSAPARLGAAIYPISSSISEMSAKMRQTTSSVSAASIQLRNCSCMVASRPRDRAGWSEERGWRAQRRAPSLRARGAQPGRYPALPASLGRRRRRRQRHTGVAQARRASSPPRLPPAPSLPLPSPSFPSLSPPCVGLRAQFDSFAPRLRPPQSTPMSSRPP